MNVSNLLLLPNNKTKRTINIVLDEAHATVSRPALFVVIPNNILIVRVRVFRQKALNQVPGFFSREPEDDMELVRVPGVHSNRVSSLRCHVLELEEIVWH